MNPAPPPPAHLTVSAIVLDPTWTQTLLVWHRAHNLWIYPGGHLEDGEIPHEAVLREIAEETGTDDAVIACQPAVQVPGLRLLASRGCPSPCPPRPTPGRGEAAHTHIDLLIIAIAQARADQAMPATGDEGVAAAR